MVSLNHLENEVRAIKERNKRVEQNKAWETSKTRTLIISIMTYTIIALFLYVSQIPYPWLNALIPALAFAISTLSLPWFKGMWIKRMS
jgi:hypothetical protein